MHVWKGNRNLTPAFSNDLELSYSNNTKIGYIQPKLFANYVTDEFHRVTYTDENNVAVTTVDNIGQTMKYGIAFTSALQFTKWWRMNTYISAYRKTIKSDNSIAALATNKQNKISTQINDMLVIGGIEKSVFKTGKITFMFIPPYIHKFTFRKTVTESLNFKEKWVGNIYADYLVGLEFTYSFNSGKKIKKLNRSAEVEGDGGKGLF